MERPRLAVLNATCLDVIDEHRTWVESQGIELLAEQSYRKAAADQLFEVLKKSDAVILPASVRNMPMAEHMAACPRLLVCGVAASGFEWLSSAIRNIPIVEGLKNLCVTLGPRSSDLTQRLVNPLVPRTAS